jgi:amphi-Trp domain-containing protein
VSSPINDFKHESLQDRESIVKYINALREGFESGQLVLGNNGNRIILEPAGMIKLDLKAKRKDGRIKLTVKINWREKSEEEKEEEKPLIIESKRD